ncbi:MAG: SH3 domain-containing protein [Devosia sp.]
MKNLMMATALAVVSTVGFAAAAQAAEATASVNVRSGPGTAYTVLDTLYPGEEVSIAECRSSGWCLVAHTGPDGWVSSRYLTNTSSDDEGDYGNGSSSNSSIGLSFSFGNGYGGPRGGFPGGYPGDYPGNGNGGPGGMNGNQNLVCLVTFFQASQVQAGADADVQSARVMTRAQAERLDRPNDRRAIFDYGSNRQTRDTCEYLNDLN